MGVKLPRGVTGFRSFDEAPLSDVEIQVLRSAGYAAARETGGKVVEWMTCATPRNYHTALIDYPSQHRIVLFNRHHLLAAVAEPHPGQAMPAFLDEPNLARILSASAPL